MLEKIKALMREPENLLDKICKSNNGDKIIVYSYRNDYLNQLVLNNHLRDESVLFSLIKQWIVLESRRSFEETNDELSLIKKTFSTLDFSKFEISKIDKPEQFLKYKIVKAFSEECFIDNFNDFEVFLITGNEETEMYLGFSRDLAFLHKEDLTVPKAPTYVDNIEQLFSGTEEFTSKVKKFPTLCCGSVDAQGIQYMLVNLVKTLVTVNQVKDLLLEILVDNSFRIKGKRAFNPIKNELSSLIAVFALSTEFELKQNNMVIGGKEGEITYSNVLEDATDDFELFFKLNKQIFSFAEGVNYHELLNEIREFILLRHEGRIKISGFENINNILPEKGLKTLLMEDLKNPYFSLQSPIEMNLSKHDIYVEICFVLSQFTADIKKSYVNDRRTYDGGSHVNGLISGVKKAFDEYFENYKEIVEKLNYVINVKIKNPKFRDSLGNYFYNSEIEAYIEKEVYEQVLNIIEKHPDRFC